MPKMWRLLEAVIRLGLAIFLLVSAMLAPSAASFVAMAFLVLLLASTRPSQQGVFARAIDSSTYLADAKIVYGTLQDQISTLAEIMNLFGDGGKMGKPISDIGLRGYQFLARLAPNWNMGFRKEGVGGVGVAGNQGLQNATVFLKYAYVPVTITGQAENLTKGNSKAFMQAKALETKFDMKDITSHLNVIVAGGERGGQIAQVSATTGAGNFTASNVALLPGAIYLRVGMIFDSGPVGGGANSVTGATITAINYATRVVTHNGGAVNVGDAITVSQEAAQVAGDFPLTMEGLRSLVDDTIAVQGLDPTVAAQTAWKSFVKDVGAVVLSSQLIHEQKAFTKNRGGEEVDMFLFPTAQINQLVGIATTTLRFDVNAHKDESVGKHAIDLGFTVYEYAGVPIIEDKDLRPDRIYAGASEMMKKFEAIPLSLAEDEAGSWTRMSGANGVADAVMGLLRWYINLGIVQRSAWSQYRNYTVPTAFAQNAITV